MMTSLLLCGRSWRTPSDYQEGACIYTTGSGMAEQQGENIPPSNCYRLVLLGSSKVGKTSLVNRFLKNKFEDVYTPTIEDFHRKIYRIKGQAYRLDLLDTSGNHPFPAIRRLSIITGQFHFFLNIHCLYTWLYINLNTVYLTIYKFKYIMTVIKLVSDLRQVGVFLRVIRFPLPIKLTATI